MPPLIKKIMSSSEKMPLKSTSLNLYIGSFISENIYMGIDPNFPIRKSHWILYFWTSAFICIDFMEFVYVSSGINLKPKQVY